MRKIKGLIGIACMIILLFTVSAASAGDYLGEFCWSWENNQMEIGVSKLAFQHIGGDHYIASGTYTNHHIGVPDPINGNAEVINNEIRMVFTSAREYSNAAQKMTGVLKVNPFTLKGTFSAVQTYIKEGDRGEITLYRGTVTPTSCE